MPPRKKSISRPSTTQPQPTRSSSRVMKKRASGRQPNRQLSTSQHGPRSNNRNLSTSDHGRSASNKSLTRKSSLGSPKTPIRKSSLGGSNHASSTTQVTRSPLRMNSQGSPSATKSRTNSPARTTKSRTNSPARTKTPRRSKLLKRSMSLDSPATEQLAIRENASSHSRRADPKRSWGFSGNISGDDSNSEYGRDKGSFADLSTASLRKKTTVGETDYDSDNSNSEWDSRKIPSISLFPDDKWWQSCLRHFRILPPVPNEGRLRRTVRRLIWATLVFDAMVAIVTIATFSGTVTMCCNKVTMASVQTIDWNTLIQVVSYIYLVGIFLEIHPVVREGPIPWNLFNPIFGSLLSFAVFVDDSKVEAISIWLLEVSSVMLEAVTYFKLKKMYQREERRLEKLDSNLNKGDKKGGQYKENSYLRERRLLRLEHNENKSKLRYHFVGVSVNFVLVCLTLLLMILVARGGGMCLVAGEGLDLFHPDQRSRCFECEDESDGWNKRCEICEPGPNDDQILNDPVQCFYPYF